MRKMDWKEKFEHLFLKVKDIVDKLALVSVFGILLYQIKTLRNICKEICIYIIEWYVDIELDSIKNAYLWIESIFRIVIVIFIVFAILMWGIRKLWNCWLEKQNGEDRFEESLFRYLRDSNGSRCFLVTGKWGAGKSYMVQRFFDRYYRYAKVKVYRISCFGLDSRKEVVEEINNIIEQKDNSLYAFTIKALQYLPIIGEPIGKFFKKSYSHTSAEKSSIFIFDDFERITSRTTPRTTSKTTSRTTAADYPPHFHINTASSLRDVAKGNDVLKGFETIAKGMDSLGGSVLNIEDFVNRNSSKEDFNKYIAVVGLINELVEVYGMKVIIICNSDVLGPEFLHNVLRSKLNCMEYKKDISSEAKISIVDNVLNNKIFDDEEKKHAISDYLNRIKNNIEDIALDTKSDDLRLFSGLLEAFITAAILFDKDVLTEEFMNSLFNSIMITHQAYYNNSVEYLYRFVTGADIQFLMKLFYHKKSFPKLIQLDNNVGAARWVDISISGFWILNLSSPSNAINIVNNFNRYRYYRMEQELCEDYQSFPARRDYSLLHVLFYQQKVHWESDTNWECNSYIGEALNAYDLNSIEVVENILSDTAYALTTIDYKNFFKALFEKLKERNAEGEISEYSFLHRYYKKFLQTGDLIF